MNFAASLSTHPHAPTAVGEVVGELLDRLGERPDACLVFVCGDHARFLGQVSDAVRRLADVGVLVAAAGPGVVGSSRIVEGQPAISAWACVTDSATPLHLSLNAAPDRSDELVIEGIEAVQFEQAAGAFLLADQSFALEPTLRAISSRYPHVRIAGGRVNTSSLGDSASMPFVVDGSPASGAVGLLLGADESVSPGTPTTVAEQGGRPVGDPMVVTEGNGSTLVRLAGSKATAALDSIVLSEPNEFGADWEDADPDTIRRHLRLGVAVEEHGDDYTASDFVLGPIVSADRLAGTITIGGSASVGSVVQFHLLDRGFPPMGLSRAVWPFRASTALVAAAPGQHDVSDLTEVGIDTTAGMVCTDQIGPAGRRHGRPHVFSQANTALVI